MPTQEALSVWSSGVYLRQSILNRKHSLFRLVGKYVLAGGALASVLTGTVSGLLAGESGKPTIVEMLIGKLSAAVSVEYVVKVLLILALLFSMDVIRCMSRLASDRDKEAEEIIKNRDAQIDAKDLLITDQRLKARLDLITRIPNEIALIDAKSAVVRQGRVLIMIDLVGFGAFNKSHSSHAGNAVLREFAQFMFLRSRRVEHVYHLIAESDSGSRAIEYNNTVFRLHRKGDEFLVVLEGGEVEALGFLNRLREATEQKDSAISLAGGRGVLFYAGIFAIDADLEPNECLHKVDQVLAHARQRPELGRVKWGSETDHNSLSRDADENERAFEFKRGLYRAFQTDPYWTGTEYLSDR
ncbi:hypothetical protein QTH90_13750 [Variovorax sp. J2P1-59]|uniref:hypothetical protein n=1 Tax=Variovorax flavidus TaxID=3053501 RepID=UPI002576927D|nr:hypothetical protein [Variovorax sp. J2P1-59]MDM0075460.1 hypothetical protein [Variovorax sp. J2P1-59]